MKFGNLFCTFIVTTLLCGFSEAARRPPGEGGAGSGNRLLAFSSATLGFTLKYSSELQLEESADGSVVVCNSRIATGREDVTTCVRSDDDNKPVSRITIGLGLRGAHSLRELRTWLDLREPDTRFTEVTIGGMPGFRVEQVSPSDVAIRAYLLSPEQVGITIEVEAYTYARGVELILPVLQTFHAGKEDHTAPTLLAIEPMKEVVVGPNRPPMIRFKAVDDASGLDPLQFRAMSFSSVARTPEQSMTEGSLHGWEFSESKLISDKDDWFSLSPAPSDEYRFRPEGDYYLRHFYITDQLGNTAVYSLERCDQEAIPISDRFYCRLLFEDLVRPKVKGELTNIPAFIVHYRDEEAVDIEPPTDIEVQIAPIIIRSDRTVSTQGIFSVRLRDLVSGLLPSYEASLWVADQYVSDGISRQYRNAIQLEGHLIRKIGVAGEQGWYEFTFDPNMRFERLYWLGDRLTAFLDATWIKDRAGNRMEVLRAQIPIIRFEAPYIHRDEVAPQILDLRPETSSKPSTAFELLASDELSSSDAGSGLDSWINLTVSPVQNLTKIYQIVLPLVTSSRKNDRPLFDPSNRSAIYWLRSWDAKSVGKRISPEQDLPPGRYMIRSASAWDRAGNVSKPYYPKELYFDLTK